MKVIIFCINYNSYSELDYYLKSLECSDEKNGVELTVVVVDNSEKPEIINTNYSFEIINLVTNKNLGYFGGAIYGIENCKKNVSDYDYSIISNVDLSVAPDFLNKLQSIAIPDDIGCIAPKIFSSGENRNRNPKVIDRYNAKKLKVLRLMYRIPVLYYLYTTMFFANRRKKVENTTREIIYAAHGSFMIFTKKFSEFIQHMNYPVFMFGEEIFIAENLRRMDLKTIYKPELVVHDQDHVSTGKMKSNFYFKCNYKAMDMLIKEYFNE